MTHLKKISHKKAHLGGSVVVPIGRAFEREFMEGVTESDAPLRKG